MGWHVGARKQNCWEESVLADGGAQGDLSQGDITDRIDWDTLGQYLEWLERRGLSVNVASFVGAGTVHEHVPSV